MDFLDEVKTRREQFLNISTLLTAAYYENLKIELIEHKQKANYWKTQFNQLKTKEQEVVAENEELKAQLRKREQQLFGKKSEKSKKDFGSSKLAKSKNKRGQQAGSNGHGRRNYDHLPEVKENIGLPEGEDVCPCCGLPYDQLLDTEDSEVIELINVKAYKRKVCRKMYRSTCKCSGGNKIITAPVADKLLPKSKFGVSIWAHLLLQKYEYQIPLYRALKPLGAHGLPLAIGTITDGFQKILPLLSPVYDAIVQKSLSADQWHADETGWKVFETIEGKISNRWYLWIFSNKETVIFKLDPSRSSKVLLEHFGDKTGGTLNVDRYVAYKVIAKSGLFVLAFCWAHVRRDFLNYSKAYPHREDWGLKWVDRIGKLYEINNNRILHQEGSSRFIKYDNELKKEVKNLQVFANKELKDDEVLPSGKKLLKSLDRHWEGLTVFVDRPEIPMDNNIAERGLRPSVIGRKNYYGSASVWSGELATAMFTIFETIKKWKINPHTWLLAYLQECAMSGGVPDNISKFLPWNMNKQQRQLFSLPPAGENSS